MILAGRRKLKRYTCKCHSMCLLNRHAIYHPSASLFRVHAEMVVPPRRDWFRPRPQRLITCRRSGATARIYKERESRQRRDLGQKMPFLDGTISPPWISAVPRRLLVPFSVTVFPAALAWSGQRSRLSGRPESWH